MNYTQEKERKAEKTISIPSQKKLNRRLQALFFGREGLIYWCKYIYVLFHNVAITYETFCVRPSHLTELLHYLPVNLDDQHHSWSGMDVLPSLNSFSSSSDTTPNPTKNNNTYFVVCLLLLGVVVDTGLAAGHLGACQVNAVEL